MLFKKVKAGTKKNRSGPSGYGNNTFFSQFVCRGEGHFAQMYC